MPTSASITYAADDYFYFYINGNTVVNGTVFDAGAPPVTVSIPPAYFNASGTNYFAAEVVNSVASLIGATWVISMVCQGRPSSMQGLVLVDVQSLSAGIYVVVAEGRLGQSVGRRQLLKVALRR